MNNTTDNNLSVTAWRQLRNMVIYWLIAEAKLKPHQVARLYYSDFYTQSGSPWIVFAMPRRIVRSGPQFTMLVPAWVRMTLRVLYPQRPLFTTCQYLFSTKPDFRRLTGAHIGRIARRLNKDECYPGKALVKGLLHA